jgi:lipopolysaccharide export system permease protein
MWKLLDRQMFLSYLKSYFVCMVSLLGLFVVVDLFTNLEDFMKARDDFQGRLRYIATYYAYNTAKNFDQISEAIVLLAAMFTVALMQRNNELLPLLSAGVSTRRAVLPALIGAMCMLGLSAANQELVMPHVDGFMVENRGDPNGEKATEVSGCHDSRMHITGLQAIKKDLLIKDFTCVFKPTGKQENLIVLQAKEAHYVPPGNDKRSGGWLLTGTDPKELPAGPNDDILEMIEPGQYFLTTPEIDFDRVTRLRNWHIYTPTWKLLYDLQHLDTNRLASVAVLFHMRMTRPILGMVLVLLGLSVILRDQNSNIFISAGLCLGLCGLFFASCFTCQSLGNYEYLSPAWAAWVPVLVFGPLALVMFDAIHT